MVTLEGPRQSGKTTLAKMAFPDKAYRSLENPDELLAAQTDPQGYLLDLPDGAVLDEVQRAPFLLSFIQGIVDDRNEPGLFILTGSQQFNLNAAVSQSLAGRTAVLKLLPLTIAETAAFRGSPDTDTRLHQGFYPRTFDHGLGYFSKVAGNRCRGGFVVYGGSRRRTFNDFVLMPYHRTLEMMNGLHGEMGPSGLDR